VTAKPVHFGPRGGLFGWWELPAATPRGCVVISDSTGYESMCAHWAFRKLSAQLATLGFAVLRVDLAGTGDSADLAETESVVEKWKWSLHQAADAARAWSGGAPLALLGLRLSGTLLAQVGAERDDVTALVLLDPASQGRLWLREQKALAMTSGLGIGKAAVEELPDGGQAILGYAYSPRTQAELGRLTLASLGRRPAKRVLVIHREGRQLDGPALDALGRDGTTMELSDGGGLDNLLKDGLFSQEPVIDFARVGSWLDAQFGAAAGAHHPAFKAATHLEGDGFIEEAQVLGAERALASIRCLPTRAPQRRATLVILNTGVNHRVGSHRTSVELARKMAGLGFASLRFDVGGVGDTAPLSGQVQNLPYNRGNLEDVKVATDWLHHKGHERFVLTGICSGGYNSFYGALADERVKAAVLTNAQRFMWKDGDTVEISMRRSIKSTQHYQTAALEMETWKRVARGEVDLKRVVPQLAKRLAKSSLRRVETRISRTLGSRFERDPVAKGFLRLCERGVLLTFVLSADDGARDELDHHLGPGLAVLKGQPHVAVEILEGADHTLTQRFARARLFEVIEARLTEVDQ
jgi:dienelactone hydrolase